MTQAERNKLKNEAKEMLLNGKLEYNDDAVTKFVKSDKNKKGFTAGMFWDVISEMHGWRGVKKAVEEYKIAQEKSNRPFISLKSTGLEVAGVIKYSCKETKLIKDLGDKYQYRMIFTNTVLGHKFYCLADHYGNVICRRSMQPILELVQLDKADRKEFGNKLLVA